MAIIQISKIQNRSGNIDELPQLSVGELGWATDAKRLFIGNDANVLGPAPDNTEILTQYSTLQAAGTNTQVQFNQANLFGASSAFAFDYGSNTLSLGGNFLPQADGVYDLGSNSLQWGNLYLSGNSLYVGGQHVFVTNDAFTTSNVTVTDTLVANIIDIDDLSASGNIAVSLNGTFGGNVSVNGDLSVAGNLTYYNISTLAVSDPIIELGGGPNGSPLTSNDGKDRGTLLHYYTTQPVDAFMGWDTGNGEFVFGSNVTNISDVMIINTLGNVRAGNFIGNVIGNISGNIAAPGFNTQVIFNSSGTLSTSANLTFNGSELVVTGNANATVFNGSGAGLTNLPGANVTGTVASATSAGTATTAGTVTTAAQPNITSVGTLSSLNVTGNTSTGGIKTDNYYYANGVAISFAGTYSDANVANYLPQYYGKVGTNDITTGSDTTAGIITGNWTLTGNSQMNATYADLAEYYLSDKKYDAGTVLAFGGEAEVTVSDSTNYQCIAGVVTTKPAYVMNTGIQEHGACIALVGRVPVRVTGKINKGDLLRASPEHAGVAIAGGDGGTIGRAIQSYDSVQIGTIEVMVGRT